MILDAEDQELKARSDEVAAAHAGQSANPYDDEIVPVQFRKARLRRDIADIVYRIAQLHRVKAELKEKLESLK